MLDKKPSPYAFDQGLWEQEMSEFQSKVEIFHYKTHHSEGSTYLQEQ